MNKGETTKKKKKARKNITLFSKFKFETQNFTSIQLSNNPTQTTNFYT